MTRHPLLLSAAAIGLAAMPLHNALAGDKTFEVSANALALDIQTELRFDSATLGQGTLINFENDLGLESSKTAYRYEGRLRLGRNHALEGSYMDLSRSGTGTLTQAIQFGDQTYNVATIVDSTLDINFYRFAYSYYFINQANVELGAAIGVQVPDINASLVDTNTNISEAYSGTAPIPTVGLRANVAVLPNLSLRGSADLFSLSAGDFDGSLTDISIKAEYRILDTLGIGVGYNKFEIDGSLQNTSEDFATNLNYDGASVFLNLRF
jgi:hypothetical protein